LTRPLIITDCDEVLLHMVVPFRQWLDEVHDIHFDFSNHNFVNGLRRKACNTVLEQGEVWDMLTGFFKTEMHRQQPIEGALETLARLSGIATIVVLTNIGESAHADRIAQLGRLGVTHDVHWNQGGKGPPARKLAEYHNASTVVFIDDLALHHESVAQHMPEAWRLHMVGEPELAPGIPAAPMAHARIDRWSEAESWIRDKLLGKSPAPKPSV